MQFTVTRTMTVDVVDVDEAMAETKPTGKAVTMGVNIQPRPAQQTAQTTAARPMQIGGIPMRPVPGAS